MEKKKNKKPTTLKGWQKLYPDAIKITASGNKLLSDNEIIYHVYGPNVKAKVLQDTSSAVWSTKGGIKASIRAIVSKQAYEEVSTKEE